MLKQAVSLFQKPKVPAIQNVHTILGFIFIGKFPNKLVEKEAVKRALDAKKCQGLLVTGDLNFPYIKYYKDGSVTVTGPDDSPGNSLIDLLNDKSLSQSVHFPTFRKAD
ncbi:hypothetical protein BpHYR1_047580, partial [Brachionus plicatilis]